MQVRYCQPYTYAKAVEVVDDEANVRRVFRDAGEIEAYIYPAAGQVQAEIYGERIADMLNLLSNESVLEVGDGLKVFGATVDYVVISVKRYSDHALCELRCLR